MYHPWPCNILYLFTHVSLNDFLERLMQNCGISLSIYIVCKYYDLSNTCLLVSRTFAFVFVFSKFHIKPVFSWCRICDLICVDKNPSTKYSSCCTLFHWKSQPSWTDLLSERLTINKIRLEIQFPMQDCLFVQDTPFHNSAQNLTNVIFMV